VKGSEDDCSASETAATDFAGGIGADAREMGGERSPAPAMVGLWPGVACDAPADEGGEDTRHKGQARQSRAHPFTSLPCCRAGSLDGCATVRR
jgi:hypothetical protein